MIQVRRTDPDAAGARFRPGDLVEHRRYGYRGVVVDLDHTCEAPEDWYRSNRTQPARDQPWYHVLVHGSHHSTYAAEENLRADETGLPIAHPLIERYFVAFEDDRYVRNSLPWQL